MVLSISGDSQLHKPNLNLHPQCPQRIFSEQPFCPLTRTSPSPVPRFCHPFVQEFRLLDHTIHMACLVSAIEDQEPIGFVWKCLGD